LCWGKGRSRDQYRGNAQDDDKHGQTYRQAYLGTLI
jgi:hypothetical protein